MTFTQLEIFALVAELRGFTAAAMRLGVSQSASPTPSSRWSRNSAPSSSSDRAPRPT